jgi:hypothetical protein
MYERTRKQRRDEAAEDTTEHRAATRRMVIQPKLMVGAVDDPAEREADAIAALTVQRLKSGDAPAAVHASVPSTRVRRSATAAVGTDPGGLAASPNVESRIRSASGTSLEPAVRARFESAMGTDLGGVRIHRSAQADELNTALHAKAFTAGNDVFFSAGSYRPETTDGQHLLAHELAHTVQQQPRVRRRVIRRFSLANADFTKTTSVNVFQKGGSGNVAQFDDGGTPLIVKVDQLIGNEVVTAGNLHSASAQQSGGSGGYSVQAPGSRLATPQERADIAAATTRLLKPSDSPRNFLTGINSTKPVVIMEKSGGQDFSDILAGGGHTKKGMFGKQTANKDSIVFQMANQPGPLTTLGQALPVDVVMGMFDRLIGYFNPDNFRYDAANQSFGFVDNTQNGPWGFITSVDIGGIYTNKESFDSWATNHHVAHLAGQTGTLAQSMFDTFVDGMSDKLKKQGDVGALFSAAVGKNKSKMLGWIKSGIDTGKASVMAQLANPLPLVNGIGDAQKLEAVQSLLAKLYVLQGKAPAVAWADAGVEAQRLLAPKAAPSRPTTPAPVPNAAPARPTTPTPGGTTGTTGTTSTTSGKSAGWKSAQPAGRWKSATPSKR